MNSIEIGTIDSMPQPITAYITSQEANVEAILQNSHLRSVRAQEITQQLLMMPMVLGFGLAGIAKGNILTGRLNRAVYNGWENLNKTLG